MSLLTKEKLVNHAIGCIETNFSTISIEEFNKEKLLKFIDIIIDNCNYINISINPSRAEKFLYLMNKTLEKWLENYIFSDHKVFYEITKTVVEIFLEKELEREYDFVDVFNWRSSSHTSNYWMALAKIDAGEVMEGLGFFEDALKYYYDAETTDYRNSASTDKAKDKIYFLVVNYINSGEKIEEFDKLASRYLEGCIGYATYEIIHKIGKYDSWFDTFKRTRKKLKEMGVVSKTEQNKLLRSICSKATNKAIEQNYGYDCLSKAYMFIGDKQNCFKYKLISLERKRRKLKNDILENRKYLKDSRKELNKKIKEEKLDSYEVLWAKQSVQSWDNRIKANLNALGTNKKRINKLRRLILKG